MAYTPTQWATGDTITASKLNKIEQGLAANPIIIHETNGTLDMTVQEIYDALCAGTPMYVIRSNGDTFITDFTAEMDMLRVAAAYNYNYTQYIRICVVGANCGQPSTGFSYIGAPMCITYQASSANAYPSYYCAATVKADSCYVGN